ncbi:cytochrome c oxidase assembly protein [Aestuariivirga sp.]|jgi:cytochrome c oxidase assembly protein subunit 11|uniref:cytochrome c oxidase assembly protein n=1 Tax=Aestuariivirga sp. TaxID=2650926 RepID=UPI00378400D2
MRQPNPARNLRVALIAGSVAVGMVGLSYAAVPLYRLFCQVTGFGGTTQRADAAPEKATDSPVSVRFDANTSGNLAWSFHAVQTQMTVKVGEQNMAYYKATNISDKPVTGTAVFNVTPVQAGVYFNKIQCFCFTEQTLQPGESIEMPVSFFVDPDMLEDPDAAGIKEITLSYTFYPVDKPKAVSEAPSAAPGSVTN